MVRPRHPRVGHAERARGRRWPACRGDLGAGAPAPLVAARDAGSFRDGRRIEVSRTERIEDAFVAHRGLLFTVAYEMLGAATDAEDVVQDTWLRWDAIGEEERAAVRDPRAFLVRVVTRKALDRLRSNARRREEYVGEWLPEPLLTSPDVADDVELAEVVAAQRGDLLDIDAEVAVHRLEGLREGEAGDGIARLRVVAAMEEEQLLAEDGRPLDVEVADGVA